METELSLLARLVCALAMVLACVLPAQAEEGNPCLMCHAGVANKKVVHPALQMGCESCHAKLDTSKMPHKPQGKIAKGLSAEVPELCFGCHDKGMFNNKFVHVPVAGGMCLDCHNPHVSDNIKMLNKEPVELCLECHPDIKTKGHGGFSFGQHPLGFEGNDLMDPKREGRKFYCGACHDPHSSEHPKQTRYGKGVMMCVQCHEK